MVSCDPGMLAERYVPLARSIASRHALSYQDFDETYSDALYGLVKAARRYDDRFAFVPYARKCIRGAIMQGRRDRSGVRVGQKTQPPLFVSLEGVDIPDEGSESDPELWRVVDQLPVLQAAVVRLYYEQDLSQVEIAGMLGVSQMRVSRLLARARECLRERIGS